MVQADKTKYEHQQTKTRIHCQRKEEKAKFSANSKNNSDGRIQQLQN